MFNGKSSVTDRTIRKAYRMGQALSRIVLARRLTQPEMKSVLPSIGWREASCPTLNFFSVQPPRTLCLCGEEDAANTHHRDAENTEIAQRRSFALTGYREWY